MQNRLLAIFKAADYIDYNDNEDVCKDNFLFFKDELIAKENSQFDVHKHAHEHIECIASQAFWPLLHSWYSKEWQRGIKFLVLQ